MWVVFTGKMIYKLWIKCARLNNPFWDYYVPNYHGFGPTATFRLTSVLSVLYLLSSFLKPRTCCVLLYFANSSFSFLYATTSSTKRRRGIQYDWPIRRADWPDDWLGGIQYDRPIRRADWQGDWSGGVRFGVFVDVEGYYIKLELHEVRKQ